MTTLSFNDYQDYLDNDTKKPLLMRFKKEFNYNFNTNFMTNSLLELKKFINNSLKFNTNEYNNSVSQISDKYINLGTSNKVMIEFCQNFIQHILQELQTQQLNNNSVISAFEEYKKKITDTFYFSKLIPYIEHNILKVNNNVFGNIIVHKIQIYNMLNELLFNLQLYQEKLSIAYNTYNTHYDKFTERQTKRKRMT